MAGPIAAAALIRLGFLAATLARSGAAALSQGDTNSYLEPGRNLLLHGRYFADGIPDLVRPPGYGLFAAFAGLAGLNAAALANVVLSVLCVILVWRLARATFDNDRIALTAAWIFAFEPVSIAVSFVLLSETLFLALFLLSLERLAWFLRSRRLPVLAVAGLALAAATFVRPVTYYLPIALTAGLGLVLARDRSLRWKAPAVLLVSTLPWFALWQIRNRSVADYGGFSSLGDVDLYYFSAVDITAHLEHRPWHDIQDRLGYTGFRDRTGQVYAYPNYLALHPEQAAWTQGRRLRYLHAQAVAVLRAHPATYLRLCVADTVKIFLDPGTWYFDRLLRLYPDTPAGGQKLYTDVGPVRWATQFAETHPGAAAEKALFVLLMLGLYLLAGRGLWLNGVRNPRLLLLLGTSLYFIAVSAAAAGPAA